MGRISGRDAEQTRRLLLDAAERLIGERGLGASLEDIARAAGVSKGGLKYHFASKEELLKALAIDHSLAFRAEVDAHLDPADQEPGRLLRAYVRSALSPAVDTASSIERHGLMARLITVDSVREICGQEAQWWNEALGEDGFDPLLTDVVVAAADGASVAPLWGEEYSPERLDALRERLLAMTRGAERTHRAQ
ncbi:TetR/AcrR family transcriptional regulator [Galactobacter caseinivorans]|uniref:TetR/AcrR family transcriptional regulator n=1 Tax=Galactobacter caseinivorans TaxID=2676123 RepID=A0A496PIV2_9MICC|nr:TetR/AcrR family transcriptional regulator [Galactobacter caseinivorans]RKW70422.1 TetR/AcrR family transcriptional regulator [Galactobacter caseinivorans]